MPSKMQRILLTATCALLLGCYLVGAEPMDQAQPKKQRVSVHPLPDGRKFEIYMEERKVEHDYMAPEGVVYREIWLVFWGLVTSETESKPVWRFNYIEHFEDREFKKPQFVPRDFHVAMRDAKRIGLAFVWPPREIVFYEINMAKPKGDPDGPLKVPKGQELLFHYVAPWAYHSSLRRHCLGVKIPGLDPAVKQGEAQKPSDKHELKLLGVHWDEEEERWVITVEAGPYRSQFASSPHDFRPWWLIKLQRTNTP